MIKILYFFSAILAFCIPLSSAETDAPQEIQTTPRRQTPAYRIELRSSAFVPCSGRFRGIYGDCMPTYGIEITRSRPCKYDYWMNFDWLTRRGSSIGFSDPTRINMASLSVGLKKSYRYCGLHDVYWGFGAVLSGVQVRNRSPIKRDTASGASFGGVVKLGTNISLGPCSYFNIFADYSVQPWVYKTNVDVGGLRAGLGLGIRI